MQYFCEIIFACIVYERRSTPDNTTSANVTHSNITSTVATTLLRIYTKYMNIQTIAYTSAIENRIWLVRVCFFPHTCSARIKTMDVRRAVHGKWIRFNPFYSRHGDIVCVFFLLSMRAYVRYVSGNLWFQICINCKRMGARAKMQRIRNALLGATT